MSNIASQSFRRHQCLRQTTSAVLVALAASAVPAAIAGMSLTLLASPPSLVATSNAANIGRSLIERRMRASLWGG